ncbi:30S ribosomal protein S3 [Candidatus Roizmanbacteria bacterium RIFCSPLOWO2_12_FULL_40_12]|uniref:Small ribosomal subunit protein uS3 n=1 Tax=Candidatus Roizmanbacteria bacterium RIFCSPLOWO2_01_FULL_40_42 TaxID=1802066 RepID=A0A1F7J4I4_9BACT|nr:MAG: 30S ribosomal protein S3 [Candidatus Roizmanbacteria bacterium RIFCSPHIGHO2_01_FULL_40_98]OGK27276.1 MAG: 30S ribosomal protein S3 [Candidatus Roizmanbacteria bacterium RIFCSPHIGHO2_02_FULL_40_53]OGK30852.1 MAG: 30S ribosomal protein S3 [Candidatus Roizmanbacteria bacterium RIFCSPHIGHO2_12_41_18]OGK36381.1 MAG: 30S ribosomal protein S3 [Candidatus Roizmanbacteria bacterium RIFCSPHIGHO2_12_FULL_40_130]OGK50509.1 MAG: 30S ribosomal protein S3 [Candidatus Roizmanbacteria bacterium RIFCSPLO
MGQKVHPKGLRLGILYNWSSRWFFSNKKVFRETLLSDINIRKKLMDQFRFASVTDVDIERAINKITVIIHSVKPGMIIGRGGKGLEDVKRSVMSDLNLTKKNKETKVDLKIEPVKKPYLNAYFVGQSIAEKLARGFPHRSVVHNTMNRVTEAGAKGVKVQLGGRIAGAEISRREKYFQGTVPTSTIREDVEFARFPALTKSGYVGVKIWICK